MHSRVRSVAVSASHASLRAARFACRAPLSRLDLLVRLSICLILTCAVFVQEQQTAASAPGSCQQTILASTCFQSQRTAALWSSCSQCQPTQVPGHTLCSAGMRSCKYTRHGSQQFDPHFGEFADAWCNCVLSVGSDGIVCIISLALGRCERVLPGEGILNEQATVSQWLQAYNSIDCVVPRRAGHPEGSDIQVAVDGRRGYLTCLCTSGNAQAVAVVWDLHSGL